MIVPVIEYFNVKLYDVYISVSNLIINIKSVIKQKSFTEFLNCFPVYCVAPSTAK